MTGPVRAGAGEEVAGDRRSELERIAVGYHLADPVQDKDVEQLVQEHVCTWIEQLLGPGESVVELGYGDGFTAARLSTAAVRYTVVEGAPSLVQEARRRLPGIEVVHSLFEDYRPAEPVDRVLALHVLEHVDDPVALAAHLRTLVQPDGEVLVVVPNRDSIHRRLGVAMGLHAELDSLTARDLLVGHQRVYDLDTLEADLRRAGLEPFERKGFWLKPLANSQLVGLPPEVWRGLLAVADDLDPTLTATVAVRARPVR